MSTTSDTRKRRAATTLALEKLSVHQEENDDDNDELRESSDENNGSDDEKNVKKSNKKASGSKKSLLSGTISSNRPLIKNKNDSNGTLKKRVSRIGDSEWENAVWAEERVSAVTKAIDRVYEMSLNRENFELFGNDMIQCFYDVATVTGEPIRHKTLKYVEHLAHRWKYDVMQQGWKESEVPTPYEVIDIIIGMYCMERVGIRHDLKADILSFMKSPVSHSVDAYFGWNPLLVPPPQERCKEVLSGIDVSVYRTMSNSLIHCFYADRVGLSFGCGFADIFKWIPKLRPYKGSHELSWQDYIDQCYMITHIIFTTNNWGELSLDPALYPHEYYFLRAHLDIHIQQRDVHLIAEFVESLRAFGCEDDDILIKRGMRSLLSLQEVSGLWDLSDEPYRTYHATMCGAQALLAHRYRGFGPGIPEVLPLLLEWCSEDSLKLSEEYTRLTELIPLPTTVTPVHVVTIIQSNDDITDVKSDNKTDVPMNLDDSNNNNSNSSNSSSSTGLRAKVSGEASKFHSIKQLKRTSSAALEKEDDEGGKLLSSKESSQLPLNASTKSVTSSSVSKSNTSKKTKLNDSQSETKKIEKQLETLESSLSGYCKTPVGKRSVSDQQIMINALLDVKDLEITRTMLVQRPSLGLLVKSLKKEKGKGNGMDEVVSATANVVISEWKKKIVPSEGAMSTEDVVAENIESTAQSDAVTSSSSTSNQGDMVTESSETTATIDLKNTPVVHSQEDHELENALTVDEEGPDINPLIDAVTGIITDAVPSDTTTIDAVPSDTTKIDASPSDTTTIDAILSDTTTIDAVLSDTTTIDAILSDTTTIDASPSDTTTIDAILSDTTTIDAVLSDTTTIDASPSDTTTIDAVLSDTTTIDAVLSDTTTIDAVPSDTTTIDAVPSDTTTIDADTTTDVVADVTTTDAAPVTVTDAADADTDATEAVIDIVAAAADINPDADIVTTGFTAPSNALSIKTADTVLPVSISSDDIINRMHLEEKSEMMINDDATGENDVVVEDMEVTVMSEISQENISGEERLIDSNLILPEDAMECVDE